MGQIFLIIANIFVVKWTKLKLKLIQDPVLNRNKNLIHNRLYSLIKYQAYVQLFFFSMCVPVTMTTYICFHGVDKLNDDNYILYLTLGSLQYIIYWFGYIILQAMQYVIEALVQFECIIVCFIMRREVQFTLPQIYFQA